MTSNVRPYHPSGAATYIIVVISIYALSIVLLIASHIRRKQADIGIHDKEVQFYLQDLPRVREIEARRYSKHIMRTRLENSGKFKHILKTWVSEDVPKPKLEKRESGNDARTSTVDFQRASFDSSSDVCRSLPENDIDSLCSTRRMSRLSNPSEDDSDCLNSTEVCRYPLALSDIPEVDRLPSVHTVVESIAV
jgi:hypothetical protein